MIKKIAIYGKNITIGFYPYFTKLIEKLQSHNIDILCYKPFYDNVSNEFNFSFKVCGFYSAYDDNINDVDFMLCIGGDGTFLETIQIILDKPIPVLGINSGRLGFLATISKEDIPNAMDALMESKYCIEQRTLLELQTEKNHFGKFRYALNDITIQKKDSTLVTIHAYLNDEFLNSYWSDGIIIATPTGSTAYSLSVGGPIVIPYSRNFIISPIAPHTLTVRPIVVPDNYVISLYIESRSLKYTITLDHRVEEFESTEKIIIKKAPFALNIIKPDYICFYETLRNKLMWGLDRRN